jgi:hypothetical protein
MSEPVSERDPFQRDLDGDKQILAPIIATNRKL